MRWTYKPPPPQPDNQARRVVWRFLFLPKTLKIDYKDTERETRWLERTSIWQHWSAAFNCWFDDFWAE